MAGSPVRRSGLSLIEILVIACLVGVLVVILSDSLVGYGRLDSSHEFPPRDSGMKPDPRLQDLAGEYHFGGRGLSCRLKILEDGRFSFVRSGCTGVHEKNGGYVTLRDGRLILSTLRPNIRSHYRAEGTPTAFLPVNWGTVRFLVAAEDVVGFCDEVNSGVYESEYRFTHTYARGLDRSRKLRGLPDLPEPWTRYLLVKPVEGKVVAASDDGTATIDLGTNAGLYAGMTIVARGGGAEFWTLKVESAGPASAVVSVKYPGLGDAPLRAGVRVASGFAEE